MKKKITQEQVEKILTDYINGHHYDCPGNCDEGRIYNNGDESAQYVCCDYCNGKGYLTEKENSFYSQWRKLVDDKVSKNRRIRKLEAWNKEQLEKYSTKPNCNSIGKPHQF